MKRPKHLTRWIVLLLATVGVTALLGLVELSAAPLLGALLAGTILALFSRAPREVPVRLSRVAQGAIGVTIGTNVSPSSLQSAASYWLPLTLVCLLTLGVSVLGGLALAARTDLDRVTGVLSLTAGGATGLTAMSGDLGADNRVVSVLQYLRVFIISFSNPLIAALLVGHTVSTDSAVSIVEGPTESWMVVVLIYVFFGLCCFLGPLLGRKLRVPAGALLVPMVIVGVAGGFGLPVGIGVPDLISAAAFFVIGWQAGLRFTISSLRFVGKLLPQALMLTLALIISCGAIGFGLSMVTGLSFLEGYLATTPGGLYVVLAVAVAIEGVDVAFVTTAQVIRVFMMLLISPLLAKMLSPGGGGRRTSR